MDEQKIEKLRNEVVTKNSMVNLDFGKYFHKEKNGLYRFDENAYDNYIKRMYFEVFPDYDGEVEIIYLEDYDGLNKHVERTINEQPGNGFPNGSVAMLELMWFMPNGFVQKANGSAFKVNSRKLGTAAHCVYDRANSMGWVGAINAIFGATLGSNGRPQYSAGYQISKWSTNQDWIGEPSLDNAFRSDFGALYLGNKNFGTEPSNLVVQQNTGSSVSGVRALGYRSKSMTNSTINYSTGSVETNDMGFNRHGWMYAGTRPGSPELVGGMSGGPLITPSNNNVIGINSSEVYYVSCWVKMSPAVYNHILLP